MVRDPRDVFVVPEETAHDPEAIGARDKFWFTRDGSRWLFKKPRGDTAEDVAEVLAMLAAAALQLPRAEYQFAIHRESHGVVSRSFHVAGQQLVLGNELLFERDPAYPVPDANSQYMRPARHTIDAVLAVLAAPDIRLPSGWDAPQTGLTAADVFGGYLLLDAWIGNTDRHHQNWGLLQESEHPGRRLAPTFDHASSLGAHENDTRRYERLRTRDRGYDITAFAGRAQTPFFLEPGSRALTPKDAWAAWQERRPCQFWRDRLAEQQDRDIDTLVGRLAGYPRATGPVLAFASAILKVNRRRILEVA